MNRGLALENRQGIHAHIGGRQLVAFFQLLENHVHDHPGLHLLFENNLFIDELLFDVLDVLVAKETID